jgi:hypothetical protein
MGVLPRTTTKLCFFALAAIGFVIIVLFGRCAMAECLSSAAQVRAEHGVAAWSTWRYVGGHKCWMEGDRHSRAGAKPIRRVVHHEPTPAARDDSLGRTVGSIPATGAIIEAVREVAVSLDISEPVTVTCDDNCLRLWESFAILESMERLLPYRVRAAARDEAYTLWLSQR